MVGIYVYVYIGILLQGMMMMMMILIDFIPLDVKNPCITSQ